MRKNCRPPMNADERRSEMKILSALFLICVHRRSSAANYFFWVALVALTLAGAPAPVPETLSRPEVGLPVNNGYPSLTRDASGGLWAAWISRRDADPFKRGDAKDLVQSDHIVLKHRDAKVWSKEVEVSPAAEQNSDPVVTPDGDGALVIWSLRR